MKFCSAHYCRLLLCSATLLFSPAGYSAVAQGDVPVSMPAVGSSLTPSPAVPASMQQEASPEAAEAGMPNVNPIPVSLLPEASPPLGIVQAVLANQNPPVSVEVQKLYAANNFEPIWLDDAAQWKRDMTPYLTLIRASFHEGLRARNYPLAKVMEEPLESGSYLGVAKKDIRITQLLYKLVRDLNGGRVSPAQIYPDLPFPPTPRDNYTPLKELVSSPPQPAEFFGKLSPKHPQYAKLREQLTTYRHLAKTIHWEPIPDATPIQPRKADPRMPAIRQRLQLMGWLDGQKEAMIGVVRDMRSPSKRKNTVSAEDRYDLLTERAVRSFQEHRGLKIDGTIGKETFDAMNIPLSERVRQIELTMERWRWLPEHLGNKYVLVNIAGFYAEGRENGDRVVDTRIIVGEAAHQTPMFTSTITDVKFYPDWSVPVSIARRYVLDLIQKTPEKIDPLGYELYQGNTLVPWESVNIPSLKQEDFPRYRFRQKPGKENALGLVRFTVHNTQSIYLHDTPQDFLFQESRRAFSSGCIRLQKPDEMAKFVLADNVDITPESIDKRFEDGEKIPHPKTEIIPVKNPVPVYVVYMTAWVDDEGDIHFQDDLYQSDKKLDVALQNSSNPMI